MYLINGRNVWRADLTEKYAQIKDLVGKRDLWVASSCSLLHSPIDLSVETRLDAEVKSWFAFALQKCGELALLRDALNSGDTAAITEWSAPIQARRHSTRVHNAEVEKRLAAITAQDSQRASPYEVRAQAQRQRFNLPKWPTTTIGSFPQTTEIRGLRLDFKKGNGMLSFAYRAKGMIKELAVINFEIAQMTVAADGAEALPDWFMMEIIRDLPRLVG